MSNEISLVFHNSSKYDHHFIIKKIANEFDDQLECIGENSEKYKKISVLIKRTL